MTADRGEYEEHGATMTDEPNTNHAGPVKRYVRFKDNNVSGAKTRLHSTKLLLHREKDKKSTENKDEKEEKYDTKL